MRLKAPWLVAHSLMLGALIGSPRAAAQPRVAGSSGRGAHATERSDQVDRLSPRVFGTGDSPWRRPGDRYVADATLLNQELRRHHVGVQVGIFNPSTDVIELGNLGFRVEQSDGLTILRYRYSLNPQIDLVAEARYWIGRGPTATSGEAKVTGSFVGPGIRVHASKGTKGRRAVPYLQGNVYYVQEMLGEHSVLHEHGIGFGVSGGVDLEVTRLISFPIEATYIGNGGGGLDDLSGFGVSVGVNFNF